MSLFSSAWGELLNRDLQLKVDLMKGLEGLKRPCLGHFIGQELDCNRPAGLRIQSSLVVGGTTSDLGKDLLELALTRLSRALTKVL